MDAVEKRLRRFVRHRFRKPAFVLQPRDAEIVGLIARHRVITSSDICLLVGGSEQNVLRRLQKLFHGGFVDRPRGQREFGNAPLVYALGQRGADLIAQETGRKPIVDWSEKNRSLHAPYIEHALMVSRFQVALRHAAASQGTVSLEQWLGDAVVRDSAWTELHGRRRRVPIAPDGVFVLNSFGGRQPGRVCGVLEADRGTMTVSRFALKLHAYFAWWRSGRAQERLGYKNFFVATVARSSERAQHLCEAAHAVSDRGLRIFLFCAEDAYLPAARCAVFESIWRTPADNARHSLLE
jgi:protein involved in plasmid replication-relaxation